MIKLPDNNKLIYKALDSPTPGVISVTFSIQLKLSEKHQHKIEYFLITAKSLKSIQKYWIDLSGSISVSPAIIPIVTNIQSYIVRNTI